MSDSAYPGGLVAQLILPYRLRGEQFGPQVLPWRELAEGQWPSRADSIPGYHGRQTSYSAPWESPIIAHADLWLAWARIPDRALAGAVRRQCWDGQRVPYRWNELVEAVWRSLNNPVKRFL